MPSQSLDVIFEQSFSPPSSFLTWDTESFLCPFLHQHKQHKDSHYKVCTFSLFFPSGGPAPTICDNPSIPPLPTAYPHA